jgi:hypothetical protein
MTADIGWEFPIDEADQWEGFNHPGIEHFRSNPFGSLAREIIQNSLDAASGTLVEVAFELKEVPAKEIPGLDQLTRALNQCSKAEATENKKAKEFFATAQRILKSKSIPVLTIRESKTTGVRGPCKKGTAYFAFMKATGLSKKELNEGDTGLGSYGIGKFAPFAVSQLRTVFVSTVYQEGRSYNQLTQGKALLTSHVDERDRTHQATGYWGVRKACMPVEGADVKLPRWLQRCAKSADLAKSLGTTFHVLGFNAVVNWDKVLIASVLENFFGAIWRGRLAVRVGPELITKETINDIFDKKGWEAYLTDMTGEPEAFNNAKHYLQTLVGTEEVLIEAQENRELGLCEIRIAVGEELPKRVAILRNGMFITDQLDRLKRFGDYKEFAAVVECQNKNGNELLRDMEPPKHDNFEPKLLPVAEQPKGLRSLTELGKWVREMLKRHARDPVADVSEVRELADYFGDDSPDDQSGAKGEEVNPIGVIQVRAQPIKRKPVVVRDEEIGDDGGGGKVEGGGGGGDGGGKGAGKGTGGKGSVSSKLIELNNVRSVPLSDKRRRVAMTPSFSGKMQLLLYEAGADTDRRLNVVKCTIGKVRQGAINITASKGERLVFDVDLDANFSGAMKVSGHAV